MELEDRRWIMASFVEKLRLNNLYPSVPIPKGPTVYEDSPPINRIPQVAQQSQMMAPSKPRYHFNEPMDTVYQPPISELVKYQDRITPYQQSVLDLRKQEIDQDERRYGNANELGQGRLSVSQQNALTNQYRAENPNARFIDNKLQGTTGAYDPRTGQLINDMGQTQMSQGAVLDRTQTDAMAKIAGQGAQRQELERLRQLGQSNLEAQKYGYRPAGENRMETYRDAQGNIIGARNTRSTDIDRTNNRPQVRENAIIMYGLDGQPYDIPLDKVDDAQAKGFKYQKGK